MIDLAEIRREIDKMTPDLRGNLPKSATEYGNMLMAMYLMGIAKMLENDDMPWQAIADNPETRRMFAGSIGFEAVKLGMPQQW